VLALARDSLCMGAGFEEQLDAQREFFSQNVPILTSCDVLKFEMMRLLQSKRRKNRINLIFQSVFKRIS